MGKSREKDRNARLLLVRPILISLFSPHAILHTGAYDDPNGSHISIEVTSALFEGKRPVQRQQLVYKALWEGTCDRFVCYSTERQKWGGV